MVVDFAAGGGVIIAVVAVVGDGVIVGTGVVVDGVVEVVVVGSQK